MSLYDFNRIFTDVLEPLSNSRFFIKSFTVKKRKKAKSKVLSNA